MYRNVKTSNQITLFLYTKDHSIELKFYENSIAKNCGEFKKHFQSFALPFQMFLQATLIKQNDPNLLKNKWTVQTAFSTSV